MSGSEQSNARALSGAGATSLAGYDYQIDVSVWLALELALVTRMTNELVLEPASQEDIEAELDADEPGSIVNRIRLHDSATYTLVVQAKRRDGDAWTTAAIKSLLEHGSERRISAAKRLENSDVRYLLVTSAGLNGEVKALGKRRPGVWPANGAIPKSIAHILPEGCDGRLAIIGNEDDERLAYDISRNLIEGCRVPNSRLQSCIKKLREEARARIRGAGGGRWIRADIENIIRDHDGYVASSRDLEHYVHPLNWRELRARMNSRNAAIIVGQSGTGKTLATSKLYEELRDEIPGLARVKISLGPQQLRGDTTPGPVLYDIEDPWGRFDFDPRSRPWNDQLAQFFRYASPDRMIIATSRYDVAMSSGALKDVKPWIVKLEAEHYGPHQRSSLFRSRIDELPRELQEIARMAEHRVLDALATPLEIQKFFDALRTQERDGLKNPAQFVADAISRAHENSIERTVIEQIEERKDAKAAAVIWSLMTANQKFSRSTLREIEDCLSDGDTGIELSLSSFVDFFVAARNLRQSDDGIITYYHPRVEAGIEKTLSRHRVETRGILKSLINLLVSPHGPDEEWGAGAAARLIAKAGKRFSIKIDSQSQARIDAWLERRLAENNGGFEDDLRLAADAGSSASNGAEIARFLTYRPDNSFGGLLYWAPPSRSDEWFTTRRSDPSTKPLIEAFIRKVLPQDRTHYAVSLVADLEKLAPDITQAFLDAASEIVHYGVVSSDDVIAAGALNDLDAFEAIVDTAVHILQPSEEEERKAAELHLDLINEVYSPDYGEYLADNDDGYTAKEFLKAYVARVRTVRGWRSLVEHNYSKDLLLYWLGLLSEEAKESSLDKDEVASAFNAAIGTENESRAWLVLLRCWDDHFLETLINCILTSAQDRDVEITALACAAMHTPDRLAILVEELVNNGDVGCMVEIAAAMGELHRQRLYDGRRNNEAAEAAISTLPQALIEIANAEICVEKGDVPKVSVATMEMLASAPDPSERIRHLRVVLNPQACSQVQDDVRWLLQHTTDPDTALSAIEAAIRHSMTHDIEAAANHQYAHVRARAITAIGEGIPAPLPTGLLVRARDRASPVRKALVTLIKAKPHQDYVTTLMQLAKDRWSSTSSYYNEPTNLPIARDAVDALAGLAPLVERDLDELFTIGIDTSDNTLRSDIFRLLANTGGKPCQTRLFELAIKPGGGALIRRAAAYGLLEAADMLDHEIISRITLRLLITRYEPVAAALMILLSYRGEPSLILAATQELATNTKRRALILLAVWVLKDRDMALANDIAAMLPENHLALKWAFGTQLATVDDALIADLGNTAICKEVLVYMRPSKKSS
ncbi:hypothetical protein [Rhizomicrobium electricum]|uniref:ATP-binding protein n=1 Tax=Rhizomicrobium electricum TaxID=480070 RepID=A0ABN1FBD1_9PROT|nr:hypothetical protein [Rhizomicrobium electricum]NIJ50534.1 hypothetical protein [Rhizomicrobium electricum]